VGESLVLFLYWQNFLWVGDVNQLQQDLQQQPRQQEMTAEQKASDDKEASFVKLVLADTEDVWTKIFGDMRKSYSKPTLVLFGNGTTSGCGNASSSSGPFYCPVDHDGYIDLTFAQELNQRFSVSGDFAMAYVVAHEVGRHVQYLMGVTQKMERIQQQVSETEYNKYSVRLELQVDFYAGVWAHYDQKMKNVISQ
jgi:predicted metalloprotease